MNEFSKFSIKVYLTFITCIFSFSKFYVYNQMRRQDWNNWSFHIDQKCDKTQRVSQLPEIYKTKLSPICSTCSLLALGGNPFIKGFAIINPVLICSIATLFDLTCSLIARYFMLMCLLWLSLLLFLTKNTPIELSQWILNGLEIESTTWSPETVNPQWLRNWVNNLKPWNKNPEPNSLWYCFKTWNKLCFYGRSSNQCLLCTSPWNGPSS